jgi:hypothetical protein
MKLPKFELTDFLLLDRMSLTNGCDVCRVACNEAKTKHWLIVGYFIVICPVLDIPQYGFVYGMDFCKKRYGFLFTINYDYLLQKAKELNLAATNWNSNIEKISKGFKECP